MSFDSVVTNPGRLRILTALAVEERQEFVHLRRTTQLTDGNLAAHAKRLESAGLVAIDKQFRDGKPVTSFVLTPAGRTALESHVRRLLSAISHRRITSPTVLTSSSQFSPASPENESLSSAPVSVLSPAVIADDDWVD